MYLPSLSLLSTGQRDYVGLTHYSPRLVLTIYVSAFLSFPDSFRFQQGSEVHTFRLRVSISEMEGYRGSIPMDQGGFIYGYAFFSRRKNESLMRGYDQVHRPVSNS